MGNELIKIEIQDEEVVRLLADIYSKTKKLKPAMHLISLLVKRSIVTNFNTGGRPIAWKPSRRTLKHGGKTLVDLGILRSSFETKSDEKSASVSTNIVYAAIHNFGGEINRASREGALFFKKFKSGKRKGRTLFSKEGKASFGKKVNFGGYTVKMPQREFMMMQDEDWPEIRNVLADYILKLK